MIAFGRPPSDKRMRRLRYMGPEDYLTICAAIRDVYAELDDPVLLKKLRYAESLAHEVVERLRKHDPEWLRKCYPKRKDYDKIMKGN